MYFGGGGGGRMTCADAKCFLNGHLGGLVLSRAMEEVFWFNEQCQAFSGQHRPCALSTQLQATQSGTWWKKFFYRIRWPRSNISPSFKSSMLFNITLSYITLSIHQASFEFVKLKLLMFKAKSYKITDVRCGDKFGGLKQRERATCIAHRYVCSLSFIIGYIIHY